jgi:hypothetical protein
MVARRRGGCTTNVYDAAMCAVCFTGAQAFPAAAVALRFWWSRKQPPLDTADATAPTEPGGFSEPDSTDDERIGASTASR